MRVCFKKGEAIKSSRATVIKYLSDVPTMRTWRKISRIRRNLRGTKPLNLAMKGPGSLAHLKLDQSSTTNQGKDVGTLSQFWTITPTCPGWCPRWSKSEPFGGRRNSVFDRRRQDSTGSSAGESLKDKRPVPASPWQRSLNGHTYGLLRQYFPKETDTRALKARNTSQSLPMKSTTDRASS